MDNMDNTMDNTTLSTIALLEARLLRIQHLLYGPSAIPERPPADSALHSLITLERRFANLLSRVRVYAELLKIYDSHPSLFQPSPAATIPTQLSADAVRATVLSFAAAFPSTASALSAATSDTPVPDPALSVALAALAPRMRSVEALQRAQQEEMAALRARSEQVVRAWYEGRVLRYGECVAETEGRVERVERGVRRMERAREMDEVA